MKRVAYVLRHDGGFIGNVDYGVDFSIARVYNLHSHARQSLKFLEKQITLHNLRIVPVNVVMEEE